MLSEGKMVIVIQLDLSAAFDTVDHAVLLALLEKRFGITGQALNWMKSYLKGRTFCVKIGTSRGKRVLLIYGVPQGSILRPLLFIIYMDELPIITHQHGISIQSYADDSQLYVWFYPTHNYTETVQRLNTCFSDIESWMKSRYLKLNAGKTKVLFIGKSSMHSCFDHLSINIGSKNFLSDPKAELKSLGSYFNGTLCMNTTVTEIVKSCNFSVKKLSALRFCLPQRTKLILIKAFIISKVDFNNILLANITLAQISRLQKVVNDAVRFVYSLGRRDHVSNFMKSAHILPVALRILYKQCVFAFNVINGLSPNYLMDLVVLKPQQSRNLRSNSDTFILWKTPDCTPLQRNIIENWNSLPYDLRSLSSDITFKSNLKTYYFNIAFNLNN